MARKPFCIPALLVLLTIMAGCGNQKIGAPTMSTAEQTGNPSKGGSVSGTSPTVMDPAANTGKVNDLDYSGYRLVWSDEFDGDYLDASFWNHETGYVRNHELQCYTPGSQNAYLQGGTLVIEGAKGPGGSDPLYTSASVNTQRKASWQYGIFEIRAKLPYGKGIWPAFWMMGDESDSPIGTYRWPACGEIDVLEMVGGGRDADATVYATAHWSGADGGYTNSGNVAGNGLRTFTLPSGVFHDSFHTFSLEWTADKFRWFVDGHLFFAQSIAGQGMEAFHKPFFLLLNLAIGGDWPGDPDETTEFPQHYTIDYVRVYQKG